MLCSTAVVFILEVAINERREQDKIGPLMHLDPFQQGSSPCTSKSSSQAHS